MAQNDPSNLLYKIRTENFFTSHPDCKNLGSWEAPGGHILNGSGHFLTKIEIHKIKNNVLLNKCPDQFFLKIQKVAKFSKCYYI